MTLSTASPLYSTHNNVSEGGGRKVHLSMDESSALCGRTNEFFNLGLPYTDIEKQFFLDPDDNGCRTCGRIYRQRTAPTRAKVIIAAMLLLVLPVLAHAQEPTKQLFPEPVKAGLQIGQDGRKTEPSLKRPDSFRSGSHYDWSFVKDPKFYLGVGTSFAVTAYDISTSRGMEATRFYRNDQGQLNKGKYWAVTGGVNAALLPLDLMPNHRWRWVSLGARVGLAAVRWNAARRNK